MIQLTQRTQEEIVQRIKKRVENDPFGFEIPFYFEYLDYDHAKEFLNDDVTKEQYTPPDKTPKERMADYMKFAWEKANACRGISAWRSLAHYIAWLWLDGDDVLWPTLEHYEFYGKPQLRKICEYLSLDADHYDDNIRVNSESEL
jgi:hypothetical protein